jgi:hypothetical protein
VQQTDVTTTTTEAREAPKDGAAVTDTGKRGEPSASDTPEPAKEREAPAPATSRVWEEVKTVVSETGAPAARPGQSAAQRPAAGADPSKFDWRKGLLNQYMYLISSPFVAIATYYLLSWLDLRKVEILVLVSFSVGLISEAILSKILELAPAFVNQSQANLSALAGAPANRNAERAQAGPETPDRETAAVS